MAKPLPVTKPLLAPLKKIDLATIQLERAICLFLDHEDFVSAVTLAGASEEILGKMLESEGKSSTLKEFARLCMWLGQEKPGDKDAYARYMNLANDIRNGLKHYRTGEELEVPREAAMDMIERALDNFNRLTGRDTPTILRYLGEARGR